jgi:hypothetical protein
VNHSARDKTPVQAALDLYTALRDSRPGDIAALTTPDVYCCPLIRPGLSIYHGHQVAGAQPEHARPTAQGKS